MEGILDDHNEPSKRGLGLPTIKSMKSLIENVNSQTSVSPKMEKLPSPKNVMPIGN